MEKIAQNLYFYNFWSKVGSRRQNKRKCGAGMHGGLPHIPEFENAYKPERKVTIYVGVDLAACAPCVH